MSQNAENDEMPRRAPALATRLSHAGRPQDASLPFVNPPIVRASTVLFESVGAMQGGKARYVYGRRGTPTSEALCDAMTDLEGAAGSVVTPSGLAAISVALLSVVSAGDHLLVVDTAYHPCRHFCDTVLKRMGVETEYYDPAVGAGIAALFRPNTRAVYLEAPGSLTFEMQDVPAIAAAARARGIVSIMDNTWATPVFFRPLDHGIDITLLAATKYVGGHSDLMLGTVSANAALWPAVKETSGSLGMFTGADDMFAALRGLRTMDLRLRRHQESALAVARWLQGRPEVGRVLHPALETDPGHALWRRDFCGATGLFGVVLAAPYPSRAVAAMLDGLRWFGLGYSWGGFESLAIPADVALSRTATRFEAAGPLIRLHVGLEDPADLIADLQDGFRRLTAVAAAPADETDL
ncbi:cystathionine beta-lyase [Prosthecomicrobium sp. N25]|uniref:cystathionine beta-lyase n=1 Tax=Prosthecomicrobium sp. N25 TaxID=3129254 RepID=UPI00307831DB